MTRLRSSLSSGYIAGCRRFSSTLGPPLNPPATLLARHSGLMRTPSDQSNSRVHLCCAELTDPFSSLRSHPPPVPPSANNPIFAILSCNLSGILHSLALFFSLTALFLPEMCSVHKEKNKNGERDHSPRAADQAIVKYLCAGRRALLEKVKGK